LLIKDLKTFSISKSSITQKNYGEKLTFMAYMLKIVPIKIRRLYKIKNMS